MSKKARGLERAACIVAAMLCFSTLALADITGSILGVVTDATGGAIPGASVSLRNSNTGLTRQATTDQTGSYEFLAVPIGSGYAVAVEATGFQTSTQSGIALDANQHFRADFQLVVGSITQKIEVSAAAAQVETTSTQVGDVIGSNKMTSLPLNGRSYLDLLGLQPGVVPISSGIEPADRTVSGTIGNAGYFSVNGNREAANAFLVNGGDVEEGRLNGASVIPTLDSLQEFRLLTNSFDAEYGRFSGGVVNAVTKSGNNGFHGTLFEFVRNNDLDSRGFFEGNQFNPATGQEIPGSARAVFKQNQFGAAIGGPILKNRLFWFSDYQGTRQIWGQATGTLYVPSTQERNGDFSDFTTTGVNSLTQSVRGSNVSGSGSMNEVLSQRLGYTVTNGEPYWVPGCNTLADAQAGTCVFPNNVIPQAAWGPVAKATLKYIPTPTATPGGTPIYSTSAYNQLVRDDKIGERIDLDSQRFGHWSFYYHWDDSNLSSPYPGANVPGFPATTLTRAQQMNVGNIHNFGATAVNEFHLNYTRMGLHLTKPTGGTGDITSFGFVKGGLGINPVDPGPPYEGLGPIYLNLLGLGIGMPSLSTGQFNNTIQAVDNFSKVIGTHTIKFGGEYRYLQINERNVCAPNGSFSFSGTETGNDFADFLLGTPDNGGVVQCSNQYLDSRTKYGGAYAQDTFKLKPNFTLNYGLRWEFSQPFYDTQGKIQAFVPGEQSHVYPDAPTGWVFPGDQGIPETLAPTRYRNFAPRLGFAYSPGFTDGPLAKIFGGPGKTSIRAAFGTYYTAVEDLTLFYEVGDAPFGLYFPVPGWVYLEEPYKSRTGPPDPGQRFPFSIPKPGSTGIWPQFLPVSGSPGFQTVNVLPYAEHINFTIQRELTHSTILSVGYVGTRGHHLIAQYSFNPGSAARCLQINAILAANNPAGTSPCGPYGEDAIYLLHGGSTPELGVDAFGTRPYSITSGRYASQWLLDFGSNTWESTMANSNYNSLQVSLQRQVGNFQFLAGYTFSKSLDDASGYNDSINPYNFRASKGLSTFDMAHNFVLSYGYTLPFEKLARANRGPLRKVLEGWQASGITRFTTGLPVGVSNGGDYSLCGCGGVDFPNWSGQAIQFANPRSSANNTWFVENYTKDSAGNRVPLSPFWSEAGHDPNLNPIYGVPGNANRRFFTGPGLNNWDFALHKMTHITEGTSVELRAEFFNIFNHAQFGGPNGGMRSSHFGQVTSANAPRIGQLALKFYF